MPSYFALPCPASPVAHLVCLVESVDERLEAGEVSDQLEDPHNSHDPHQTNNLTRLTHDLEVLERRRINIRQTED